MFDETKVSGLAAGVERVTLGQERVFDKSYLHIKNPFGIWPFSVRFAHWTKQKSNTGTADVVLFQYSPIRIIFLWLRIGMIRRTLSEIRPF